MRAYDFSGNQCIEVEFTGEILAFKGFYGELSAD
jgi:hypothetical protein